jgi:hypothetical protein
MKTFLATGLIFLAFLAFVPVARSEQSAGAGLTWGRCSEPPVEPCFRHRGRLSGQNGIAHMIWLVGTKRIVAVDNAGMPDQLWKYLDMASPDHADIYGDYEICPLERDRPGNMRRVCVSSASRLVVQDRERSRAPIRLLFTWPKARSNQ